MHLKESYALAIYHAEEKLNWNYHQQTTTSRSQRNNAISGNFQDQDKPQNKIPSRKIIGKVTKHVSIRS